MNNPALVNVSGLRAGYGNKPVLQGMDLRVHTGEIVAVIGRNGVGKSTLMKSMIGLLPCAQGSIAFAGRSVQNLPAWQRARLGMGYVPQGRDVFPRMTVEENLRVGESLTGRVHADAYERIYGYFPILRERRRQMAGTLSGGQQQQLALGRVLVGAPRLMLLDEPSEGIQPSIVKEISRLVLELNRASGLTVLFVEQNIDMIQAMAQRCYVMDKGRMTEELSPAMLSDPQVMKRCLSI